MKLSQLRILVAVADRENFSEAALDLEMSQSAVSHAIATLEDHLGVILFLRGRHGDRLTPVGKWQDANHHGLHASDRADGLGRSKKLGIT